MGKKNKEEEPVVQAPAIERPQDYTPDPFQVKKDLYKRDKDLFFSDERLYRQDSVTQRNTLGKFFDNISTPFYKEAGVADDAVLKELREKFINDNISKLSLAKKKEEEPEPVVSVEYPDFFDKSKIYEKTYARQNAIKPIMTDVDVSKLDQAHKAQRESDERISSFVPKMLETPEFGYIKSRPEDFLELTKLEESNISKYLKSQGLNSEEREVAWAILNNTATQSFLKKTRENYTPEQLNKESLQYAEPYLDNAEPGTFMDPKTGMRKSQAETEEDADQLALLHKYQQEILKSVLLSSTTHPLSKEQDKLDEEQEALSAEYEKLEELRKIADKSVRSRSETWMDDMEAWKRSQLDFIKKEKDLEKKINDFNNKIKEDKSAISSITKDVTDREKLQQVVNDAYLLKKYWDDRFTQADKNWSDEKNWVPGGSIQMRTFGPRPEFQATMDRIGNKRAEATAYFEAASRMLYNNEGPLDIKKDLGFYTEMLGDAMVKTILKKNYPTTAPQTEFETLQKMGELGMREGITFTKEEADRLKVGFLEHATLLTGTLLPDLPGLIFVGGATNILKSGKLISNLRYGSKVVKNIASQGTRTLAFDDAVPAGWKVIYEMRPTVMGKLKGAVYSTIIDEVAFTGILGMAPGMISGMNTAHLFLPNIVLMGKIGSMIQPYLDMAYKGAVGSTVGMEMGAATSGIVNALFTEKTFSDAMDELYPNLEDSSKRVLAELAVNGIFFGGMGALTKGGQKAATAPLGGKYGKNGKSSWTAYFNPVFRKRVFEAAKEADSKGYTDTARELYRWLDSTKEPITGDDITQARMQETEEMAKVMPVGVVRSSAEANRQAIYKLEELKEDPNFDGYVTVRTRTSKDVKNGDTVEMEGKYYEVTDVTRDKKGNPIEFILMDVETGEPTKALTEDVKTDLHYKVGSRLELSLRLENHYEKLQVLNEVLAERGFYGKDFKALPAGPEAPKQLGKSTGVEYVKPPEPKKIDKILKTIEKRQAEMQEETGEKIVLPEALRPIEKFGVPEKIIETPVGEFSENLNKVKAGITKEVERINGEIEKIDEKLALPEFRGRVEAGKRAEKIQLTSERDKLQNQLEAIKLKGNKEFTEFWKAVSPVFSDYIKSKGDFSEDEVQEIIKDAWGKFSQPSEDLKEATIGQIFDESIAEYVKPKEEEVPEEPVIKKAWDKNTLIRRIKDFNALTTKAKTGTSQGAWLANQIRLTAERLGFKISQDGNRNFKLTTATGGKVGTTPTMPTKEEIADRKLLKEYPEEFQKAVGDIIDYTGFKYLYLAGLSPEQREQAERDLLSGKKSQASKVALSNLEKMIETGILLSYDAIAGEVRHIPLEELRKEVETLRQEERAKELEKLLPYQADEAYEKGLLTKEERDGINEIIRSANIEPEAEPTGEEDITTAPTGTIQRPEEKPREQKPTDFGIEPNGGINPYLFKVDQYYSDYNNGLKVTVANRRDSGKSLARMRELNDIIRDDTLSNTIDYIQSMLDIYDKGMELMPETKANREEQFNKEFKEKLAQMRNAPDFEELWNAFADTFSFIGENMRNAFKELDFESNGIYAIKQAINKTADEIQKKYGSVKNIKDARDVSEKPALEGPRIEGRKEKTPYISVVEDIFGIVEDRTPTKGGVVKTTLQSKISDDGEVETIKATSTLIRDGKEIGSTPQANRLSVEEFEKKIEPYINKDPQIGYGAVDTWKTWQEVKSAADWVSFMELRRGIGENKNKKVFLDVRVSWNGGQMGNWEFELNEIPVAEVKKGIELTPFGKAIAELRDAQERELEYLLKRAPRFKEALKINTVDELIEHFRHGSEWKKSGRNSLKTRATGMQELDMFIKDPNTTPETRALLKELKSYFQNENKAWGLHISDFEEKPKETLRKPPKEISDLFPDDRVLVDLKDGTTQEMSFRGWSGAGRSQAVVYNRAIGQLTVDKSQLRLPEEKPIAEDKIQQSLDDFKKRLADKGGEIVGTKETTAGLVVDYKLPGDKSPRQATIFKDGTLSTGKSGMDVAPPEKKKPPVDVAKDLKDMTDLLKLLGTDELGFGMEAGGPPDDIKIRLGQMASGMIEKFTKAGIVDFPEILSSIIPQVNVPVIKKLFPFLKQGYTGYYASAPEEIASQMEGNLKSVRQFQESDLDALISKVKNIETPEPAEPKEPEKPVVNKGKKQDLDDLAKGFDEIGDVEHAEWLRSLKDKEEVTDEMMDNIRALAQEKLLESQIKAGAVWFDKTPFTSTTETMLFAKIEKMHNKGVPLEPFIRDILTPEQILQAIKCENQLNAWLSTAGLTQEKIANFPFLRLRFEDISIARDLFIIGETAENSSVSIADLNSKIKALDNALIRSEAKIVNLRKFLFTWRIKYMLNNGIEIKDAAHLRRIASETFGFASNANTAIREQAETALVELATVIARNGNMDSVDRFNRILSLYESFPSLKVFFTSEVKEKQQFSTPVPLAYAMGRYTNGLEVDSMLDPSAGNGALTIAVGKRAVNVNEIDMNRYRNLADQGYRVYSHDARESLKGKLDRDFFDVIHTNPPFGLEGVATFNGEWKLGGTSLMVARALEMMADHGKAAIIIGGHTKYSDRGQIVDSGTPESQLRLFNYLYKYYNVEDVINVPGDFYSQMGTSYPVRLILINGRKAAPIGAAPLQSARGDLENPVASWNELYERIDKLTTAPNEKAILRRQVDANREPGSLIRSRNSPVPKDQKDIGPVTPVTEQIPEPTGERTGEGETAPIGTVPKPTPGVEPVGPGRPDNELPPDAEPDRGPEGPTVRKPKDSGKVQFIPSIGDLPEYKPGVPAGRTKRTLGLADRETDQAIPYAPLSRVPGGNSMVPATMANELEEALLQLKEEIGDIDTYVMSRLKYNSIEDLSKAFYAEQVDALGMAIFNIENGGSVIVGDQTGVGKGRVAAGIIAYTIESGHIPVFITKSANLFTDIYRDLIGIGKGQYIPFIMNKEYQGEVTKIFKPNTDEILYQWDPNHYKAMENGMMPGNAKFILATYSQFNTDKGNALKRRNFLLDQAWDSVFIMDESHEASGASNTGKFFQEFIFKAKGGIFLSATFAKRPDNMPVYAMKTVLQEANLSQEQLVEAIAAGGPALQEIISSQLTESIQFTRRQLNMEGIERNWYILGDEDKNSFFYNPELGKQLKKDYDGVTTIMHKIINFQRDHVKPVIQAMDEEVRKEGEKMGIKKGTADLGVNNASYFSKVFNIVNQLLLAVKVPHVIPMILEELSAGRKPFITLSSTMEAMLDDLDLDFDQEIEPDFRYVLKRGLDGVLRYTKKTASGVSEHGKLEVDNLSPTGQAAYWELNDLIKSISTGITISPIDVLIKGITDAGFKVAEITGRHMKFDLSSDYKKGKYVINQRPNKNTLINSFNNEPGWAIIANVSGSTGLSAHSSGLFKDTSQRVGFNLQTDLDVNIVVQKEGRINRSDQVNKPTYINVISVLPAEKRLAMMNAKKLKSLYANTSSNQKSSKTITDAVDFLNKYGDEVVGEWLKENPDINKELGEPLDLSKDPIDVQNAAHKVTGKVAVLSTDVQERFYNEVLERYEAKIEYLDSTGGNDLAVNGLPLNATTLSSETVIQGKGGISVFGDDSVLETIEVDVLKKPIPQKDLMDLINKELEFDTVDTYKYRIKEDMKKSLEENLAKKLTALQQSHDSRVAAKRKAAQDRKGTAEENARWLNNELLEMEEKHIILIQMYEEAKNSNMRFYDKLMTFFYPGKVLEVPFTATDQLGMVRMNKGVFLGFDINMKKQNPFAPSSVMLRFATADSRRSFRIPASKSEYISSIMGHSYGIGRQEQEETLENWDKLKPAKNREKRFVVTGNILQAMPNYKGRLIEFTMQDGSVRKGILMPENWIKDDDGKVVVPAMKMYNIIRALDPMDYVESVSRNVQIQRDRPSREGTIDNFFLKVPASRTRGEKFWSDEILKSFIENNRFEGRGDWMVGRFRPNDIIPILEHLQNKFNESFEVRAENVQRYESSQESAINMLREMDRVTKEMGGHGETRPEAEVLGAKGANMKQRVGVEPITGKKPKKIWEIEKDFADALGQKIFWDKTARKGMAASYTPALGKVVMDKFFITNLNIAAHELGHRLDDMFGLVGPEAQPQFVAFERELKELWQFGSKPPKGHKNPLQYQMMEGVAEYFRAFVVNPKETVRRYPVFSKWFEQRIRAKGDKVWNAIGQFSEDVRSFYGARGVDKIQSNMKMGKQANEKLPWGWSTLFKPTSKQGDFAITMFDLGAIKMLNSTRAAEKAYLWALAQSGKTINPNDQFITDKDGKKSINPKYIDPRENFIILARLLNGNMDKIGNMMMSGVTNGKLRRQYDPQTGSPISFVWKYEALPDASIPEMEKFRTEALAFMVGERVIEAIGKFVQKQLRMDLEAFEDMIPPLDILKKYPHVYEKYLGKIQRILDRWAKEDLDDNKVFLPKERYDFDRMQIIGVNQEGFTDKMVAEQSVAEFAQLKKDNPERAAMMEEYARRHRLISMAYIRYAYEMGLISPDLYEMIVQEDLHYVSLHRYFQETGPTTEGSPVKGFDDIYTIGRDSKGFEGKLHIYPLKGSARPIVDPDLIQAEAAYSLVLNADKNNVLRFFALAFTGGREPYEGEPIQFADIGYMVKGPGQHVLKFFIGGKPLYFKVQNPYVYKPLKGLLETPQLPGWATLLPRILRNAITLSPPFAVKNKIRDMNNSMMIAETKYKPSDWKEPKGLKGVKMEEMYDLAGGGQFGFYIRSKTDYYRLQKEWMFKHSKDPKKFFLEFATFINTNWDTWTSFMSKSEKSTRIAFAKAEFNRLVKGGMDPFDALLQSAFSARDLLDFHVAGEWMKVINQFIPFSNAAIRGLDKVIRTARDRPGNLVGSWLLLAIMPAIANSMMIAMMDDDTVEEYKQLPPYQRDMFFNIPLGNGRWLTIPKPFELGYMSSAVQRIADKYLLNDEVGFNEDWFRLGYNMLFPFDFSGITGGFAGIVHATTKRDYFRGTWVIPPSEMDVAIVTRNTERATRLGQAIQNSSRILSKKGEPIVDARMVDDFIESQVPYYGTYFLKATELISGGAKQRAMRFDWNDLGLVKSSPMYNAEDVQWVLKTAKKYKLNRVPEMDLLNTVIRLYFSEEIQNDRAKMLKVGRDARVIATEIRKKWDRPDVNFAKMYEEYKATK